MAVSALVADVELPPTRNGFEGGLLLELLAGLRACPDGGLVAITSSHVDVADNLERWSRFTGNAIVGKTETDAGTRWVVRNGAAPTEPMRRVGARLWLYSNFDCNLACQYCCVRSTPRAERRALGLDVVQAIAREARDLGTEEIFITGGEPFLLADIDDIARACAEVAPTTILTNGALFSGKRRDALDRMPRDRVTLQISLDSPTPHRHDLLRGEGTWDKAWRGIRTAREMGFRVRLAATVASAQEEAELDAYFAAERLAPEDRVVRRLALRGFSREGLALSRADLVPELTITARGVYWHPVGADDEDFFVTAAPLPLARAAELVDEAYRREPAHALALAEVFHCA